MAAYVVLNIDVTDSVRYADYVKVAGSTVEQYGGKYLVRGGKCEKLEGPVEPKRFVIPKFPSYDRAKAWWDSSAYETPKAIRQSASISHTILAEGVQA